MKPKKLTLPEKIIFNAEKMKIIFHLLLMLLLLSMCNTEKRKAIIMTVKGPVPVDQMGVTLTHEHILVDFIGADSISESRWDRTKVINKVMPYLRQIRELGCRTFVECTPAFLGRDPLILKSLSDSTGLNIITNTGFYGAHNNKFIPAFAFNESADQLAQRWIKEWEQGIGNTGIRPGFIKIAVNSDSLSEFHKKLVMAAALAHLKTGLTIASHTGPAIPAFQQIEILGKAGVSPDAFIWVHAMNEKEPENLIKAAQEGAWISLDNVNETDIEKYINLINILRQKNLLNKVLVSHDAGWYDPAKENGGDYRGYTTVFEKLIPALKKEKFTEKEINQLFVINPAKAFEIKVRLKE
jgi:phosphotriesterase-related protein